MHVKSAVQVDRASPNWRQNTKQWMKSDGMKNIRSGARPLKTNWSKSTILRSRSQWAPVVSERWCPPNRCCRQMIGKLGEPTAALAIQIALRSMLRMTERPVWASLSKPDQSPGAPLVAAQAAIKFVKPKPVRQTAEGVESRCANSTVNIVHCMSVISGNKSQW